MYPPPEPLPELDLLDNLDDAVARLLWRAVRDTVAWAESPGQVVSPGDEHAIAAFRENLAFATGRVPELREAFGSFGLLRLSPKIVQLGQISRACEQVHAWADEQGLYGTALLFAEAWGRTDRENPIASNTAGRAARMSGHVGRAEIWFDRGYKLAARKKNRREQIRARIGLGGLLREMGRYTEARELLFDAARLAGSSRRHRQAAEVQHELMTIAAETGNYPDTESFMRSALNAYPVHHRALPWLAHDWAFFLVRLNLYDEARVLLEAIRAYVTRPDLQVIVEGTLGRAAACTGDRARYNECRARVLRLIALHEEYAAAALAHLAIGAQYFEEWDTAERLAERSVEIALARHQHDVEQVATELLRSIRVRERAAGQCATPPSGNRIASIERQMLARLAERKKPRRRGVVEDPEAGGRPPGPPREGQPTGPGIAPDQA